MNAVPLRRTALALILVACAAARAQTCVPLEVHNVLPGQGTLMVAVFASAEDFDSKKSVAALQMRTGSATTLSFPLCIAAGSGVALTLYQDLNDNGKLDTNVLGIPSEPWGASGHVPAFSAPTWATAQVPFDGSAIVVRLSK